MNLSEFLLARIAEDETAAWAAGADEWEVADQRKVRWVRNSENAHGWVAIADISTASAHIARHDPARVLAECEAKRRIVELAVAAQSVAERAKEMGWPHDVHQAAAVAYGDAIRALALPYADHEEFQEEWRV